MKSKLIRCDRCQRELPQEKIASEKTFNFCINTLECADAGERISITFPELSEICERRVVTESWFDADKCPPWDWTCTTGDFDSEMPKLPVIGKEKECLKSNCPIWRRLKK